MLLNTNNNHKKSLCTFAEAFSLPFSQKIKSKNIQIIISIDSNAYVFLSYYYSILEIDAILRIALLVLDKQVQVIRDC